LQALCLDIQVLDEHGNQIELKDDEEETYQPSRFRDDDYDHYESYGSESEFADAGYTMKETSDDDDLFVGADTVADGDDFDFGDED